MREMWELPRPSAGSRATRVVLTLALVWATVAVPLTVWLALRTPPPEPVPATRTPSVLEAAALRYAGQTLSTGPVTLASTVTTATARLEVQETADPSHAVSYGKVRSGTQTAELLVIGTRVLLRGDSAFWSSVGVPTAEPGWIEVGDRLGRIPFPLSEAITALGADKVEVNTPAAGSDTMTARIGNLVADFNAAGVSALTVRGRSAAVTRAPADAPARVSAVAGSDPAAAKLVGASGSLTVSAPPAPEPPPVPAPGS
ncbi:hypothetical protein [Mycobacterium dioxanotrophicus]|uniref:hypothetical protein n=1 Tax=Mycobacterium dioxanotrophicus TaxID=482462 RepID=UPI0012FC71B5|nr:hypothetical protein [Mycobacterium dioxanotrophicus]